MRKINYILGSVNLLNLILAALIFMLANYVVLPLFNMNVEYTPPAGRKTPDVSSEKPADANISSPSDYTMIIEQNLFHPERTRPVEKKEAAPLPKPEFLLYGTLITDDTSIAYIEDLKAPVNTAGRGKRQKALRLGSSLSGFTLKDIQHDKAVLVRGEERIEVKVTSSQQRKTKPQLK